MGVLDVLSQQIIPRIRLGSTEKTPADGLKAGFEVKVPSDMQS